MNARTRLRITAPIEGEALLKPKAKVSAVESSPYWRAAVVTLMVLLLAPLKESSGPPRASTS
jgi:hypothetical protein